jgi:hypothetical protein
MTLAQLAEFLQVNDLRLEVQCSGGLWRASLKRADDHRLVLCNWASVTLADALSGIIKTYENRGP